MKPADALITQDLATRARKAPNLLAEATAFRELSALMVDRPEAAVKRFLELAVQLCDAGSAGLSLLEASPDGGLQFCWDELVGPLSIYQDETTVRDFSPFGLALEEGRTVLVDRPFRALHSFNAAAPPMTEGLLVPLHDSGGTVIGTIVIVHHEVTKRFDAEDARLIEQLAIQLVLALKLRGNENNDGSWSGEAQAAPRADERWKLIVQELEHRIRNTLALVSAIVGQTLRTATSLEAAQASIDERIASLSRAQDLLTARRWKSLSIGTVVERALEPHTSSKDRIRVDGPEVELPGPAVVSLTLALNELATNATKYGALSNQSGRVDLSWRIEPGGGQGNFVLIWLEAGGPTVVTPTRRGFGSRLLERVLASDFGGTVRIDFDPEGVRCLVMAPLVNLAPL